MLGDPYCPTPPLSLPPTPGTSQVGAGGGETLPLTRNQDSPDCPLPTDQAGPEAVIRDPQPRGRPGETRGTFSSLETGTFCCNRTSPELCYPLATTPSAPSQAAGAVLGPAASSAVSTSRPRAELSWGS